MPSSTPARGDVGWADAVAAAAVLGASDREDVQRIVDLVGLAPAPIRGPLEPRPTFGSPHRSIATTSSTGPEPEVDVVDDEQFVSDGTVTEVMELPARPFDYEFDLPAPLEVPPAALPAIRYVPPVPKELIRASITAVTQRPRESTQVDIERVVHLVARRQPLVALPRTNEPTNAPGIIVLADVGRSMMPYRADVDHLLGVIEDVVGRPNVEVRWVYDEDTLADRDTAAVIRTGRPVLILSTLGAVRAPGTGPHSSRRWVWFAQAAADVDADVTALVPHRLRRWPAAITSAVTIVTWGDLARRVHHHG